MPGWTIDRRPTSKRFARAVAFLLFTTATGCQQSPVVPRQRLIGHQAAIDLSDLKPVEAIDLLKVTAAVPSSWELLPIQKNLFYVHEQWKSPSKRTGVGVVHVQMPIPINRALLVWIAKQEYSKKGNDGRVLREWTDDLGRRWFEAENNKYHVQGYVVVRGFQAWVVYCGNKVKFPLEPAELSLAARAAESVTPNGKVQPAPTPVDPSTSSERPVGSVTR